MHVTAQFALENLCRLIEVEPGHFLTTMSNPMGFSLVAQLPLGRASIVYRRGVEATLVLQGPNGTIKKTIVPETIRDVTNPFYQDYQDHKLFARLLAQSTVRSCFEDPSLVLSDSTVLSVPVGDYINKQTLADMFCNERDSWDGSSTKFDMGTYRVQAALDTLRIQDTESDKSRMVTLTRGNADFEDLNRLLLQIKSLCHANVNLYQF